MTTKSTLLLITLFFSFIVTEVHAACPRLLYTATSAPYENHEKLLKKKGYLITSDFARRADITLTPSKRVVKSSRLTTHYANSLQIRTLDGKVLASTPEVFWADSPSETYSVHLTGIRNPNLMNAIEWTSGERSTDYSGEDRALKKLIRDLPNCNEL